MQIKTQCAVIYRWIYMHVGEKSWIRYMKRIFGSIFRYYIKIIPKSNTPRCRYFCNICNSISIYLKNIYRMYPYFNPSNRYIYCRLFVIYRNTQWNSTFSSTKYHSTNYRISTGGREYLQIGRRHWSYLTIEYPFFILYWSLYIFRHISCTYKVYSYTEQESKIKFFYIHIFINNIHIPSQLVISIVHITQSKIYDRTYSVYKIIQDYSNSSISIKSISI